MYIYIYINIPYKYMENALSSNSQWPTGFSHDGSMVLLYMDIYIYIYGYIW